MPKNKLFNYQKNNIMINSIKEKVFYFRLKRAIRNANEMARLSGNKFLVLNFKGKPIVKSKQNLKKMIARKELNTTIQYLEAIAYHVTN